MDYSHICQTKDPSGDAILKLANDPAFVEFFQQNTSNCMTWFAQSSDPSLKCVPKLLADLPDSTSGSGTATATRLHTVQSILADGLAPQHMVVLARVLGVVVEKGDNGPSIRNLAVDAIKQAVPYIADPELHDHVVVVLARALAIADSSSTTDTSHRGRAQLAAIVDQLLNEDSKESLQSLFELISFSFHVDQTFGKELFTNPTIQNHKFNSQSFVSEAVVIAAMEALSSACLNKDCRGLVAKNFRHLVEQVFDTAKSEWVRLLAASVVVKSAAGTATADMTTTADDASKRADLELYLQQLSDLFETYLADCSAKPAADLDSDKAVTPCLESLAYTSLMEPIRLRLTTPARRQVLRTLCSVIQNPTAHNGPRIYCALTILANVSQYTPKLNQEQQKVQQLRDYANQSKLGQTGQSTSSANTASDAVVDQRNQLILDTGVVSVISNNGARFSTPSKGAVAILMRNLVTNQKHRPRFVKEGGLAVLLYILQAQGKDEVPFKRIATSALARALISTNPDLAFSERLSPATCIPPLVDQLQLVAVNADLGDSVPEGLPLLDVFESLMALTNLASSRDENCRTLILRSGFTQVENLLTTCSNPMVQRACLELICNLSMSPLCAEKYLDNTSSSANQRLQLLAAFANSEDPKSAIAASGALAMLSEYGQLAVAALVNDQVVDRVIRALSEQDSDDVLVRLLVVLQSILADRQQGVSTLKSKRASLNLDKIRHLGSMDPDLAATIRSLQSL